MVSKIVGVLSLSEDDKKSSMQKWLRKLRSVVPVNFETLPCTELINFQTPTDWENVHAVILLHSITKAGRLSLTDVDEARYDKLLETLHEKYSKLILW